MAVFWNALLVFLCYHVPPSGGMVRKNDQGCPQSARHRSRRRIQKAGRKGGLKSNDFEHSLLLN